MIPAIRPGPWTRQRGAQLVLAGALALELIPLFPRQPAAGLDNSWQQAINVAAAERMHFGTDVVFTYGPLAGVNSWLYQPGIWGFILPAAIALATGFVVATRLWLKQTSWLWSAAFAGFVLFGPATRESLFLVYPLLVVLAVGSVLPRRDVAATAALSLLTGTLGLLPLVKVSSVLVVVAAVICIAVLAFQLRRPWLAAQAVLSPIVVMVLLWLVMGQPLSGITRYVESARAITAGYSDAMSLTEQGPGGLPTVAITSTAIAVVLVVALVRRCRTRPELIALVLMWLVTAPVVAKEAFVRADTGHLVVIWPLLAIGICLAWPDPGSVAAKVLIAATLAVVGWLSVASAPVDAAHRAEQQTVRALLGPVAAVDHPPWSLHPVYETAEREIAASETLPTIHGTVDLYPDDLSALFAAGADWDPRPVIQSYSVYTPALARANRDHLLGAHAPGTLVFRVSPIDGRLAALEDGFSWLSILRRYQPSTPIGDYIILRRARTAAAVEPRPWETLPGRLGTWIDLPKTRSGELLQVSIEVKPTLLGRARTLLWRPPFVSIDLAGDGLTTSRRFLPTVSAAPFVISPYVSDTQQFVSLYGHDEGLSRVSRIRLVAHGAHADEFWSRDVMVRARVVTISRR